MISSMRSVRGVCMGVSVVSVVCVCGVCLWWRALCGCGCGDAALLTARSARAFYR